MPNPFDTNPRRGNTATKTRGGLEAANGSDDPTPVAPSGGPFAIAGGGGGDYRFTDFLHELLLVQPVEVETMATKIHNETEVVRVNVIRLENDNEQIDDLLVFQVALIRNLKKVLRGPNSWVLGRLELGEEKNGKNAPYILTKPTDDEVKLAQEVMTSLGLI